MSTQNDPLTPSQNNRDPEVVYERLLGRYESGQTPWDLPDPPPEVWALANDPQLIPGRALDVGCGYGRASLFLARHGWQVDGIDFVQMAVDEATARATTAGVADRTRFFHGSITDLSRFEPGYDLILDVGCAHSLSAADWQTHHAELKRLLRPGGRYLIYGRLFDESDDEGWGLIEPDFVALMADGFALERSELGVTNMPDGRSYDSGWFWFMRDAA